MMVRKGGFEPPRLSAPPPQDGVSASSTTSALESRACELNPQGQLLPASRLSDPEVRYLYTRSIALVQDRASGDSGGRAIALLPQRKRMSVRDHLRITAAALRHWAIAQAQDSLAVGLLWLIGLWIIRVPWAPLWAFLAAVLQIVPHIGPVLGLLGPVLAAALHSRDWEHPLYVLILYAVIVVIDGFFLQPYIMRRVARVPMWASILAPLALGFIIPFWGVLLAPPLLAVAYAYKARRGESKAQ